MRWLLVAVLLASCMEREERRLQVDPARPTRFAGNAWDIGEGQRLFGWYNCSGCHANGGGGIGPALMDDKWIYGGRATDIVESILQGRPNGMPSFGKSIPEVQAWQIAEFVRSLGADVRRDSIPGRTDGLPPFRVPPASIRQEES